LGCASDPRAAVMIKFELNGTKVSADLPDGAPLVSALRDHFGLYGTRYGCGEKQCGACMVLIDGKAEYSCTRSVDTVAGREVITVEGLGHAQAPHALQHAFLAEQAGQCGYCLSGMLISAAALLMQDSDPDDAAVRAALEPNLCRCGAHNRIVRAVLRAAAEMRAAKVRR
jgi:nicotinate dehydrogenase subunit A